MNQQRTRRASKSSKRSSKKTSATKKRRVIPIPEAAVISDAKALECYTPVCGYVMIKRHEVAGLTQGGVALPANHIARKRNGRGTVMRVPAEWVTDKGISVPLDYVEAGDQVLFSEYSVTEIVAGGEHILVKATDIYCVIEGDEFS